MLVLRLHRFRDYCPRSGTVQLSFALDPAHFVCAPASVAVCLESDDIDFAIASQEGDNPSPGALIDQLFWNPTSSISLLPPRDWDNLSPETLSGRLFRNPTTSLSLLLPQE